ncbi:MAG: MBL fold metallo-hydrolase [Candidatus Lokiarchaeota archaeon]|nr:MBL fold metallo-hydrolase [Candidatus Lokiarchaeota archaeon]
MVVQIDYHCNDEIIEWKWSSDSKLMTTPFFTSCYLVDGLLIDSGAPGGVNDLREFVNSLNPDNMIEKCFITHAHEDHAGGANLLSREFGIPIYAGEKAIELLKLGNSYPDYRQMAWGPKLLPVDATTTEELIFTKSKKYKFEFFPMNGHAPELIALIEREQQWAFVADAVQPKYKMIFGGHSDIQEDISLIYHSLGELYEFTEGMDNLLIFSAGNGVFHGRKTLLERRNEIKVLHLKIHEMLRELPTNILTEKLIVRKLLREIHGKESFIGQMTRGALSRKNLIRSLLKWAVKN